MGVFTITVKTTPTRILVRNEKRVVYTIINNDVNDVYVGFDSSVSTSGYKKGILLSSGGGVWSDEYHNGEVWAIASGAETEITVIEVSKGE